MRPGAALRAKWRDDARYAATGETGTRSRPKTEVLREIIEQCGDSPECAEMKRLCERQLADLEAGS